MSAPMPARHQEREARLAAARRLMEGGAVLSLDPATGGYALHRGADRRRRAAMRLSAADGEALLGGASTEAGTLSVQASRVRFLPREEQLALERLSRDLEAGEGALLRGQDWSRPAGNRARRAETADLPPGAAARARARQALSALAPPLAELVEAQTAGADLAAFGRKRGWPAQGWRLALQLAAAQLGHYYRYAAGSAGAD